MGLCCLKFISEKCWFDCPNFVAGTENCHRFIPDIYLPPIQVWMSVRVLAEIVIPLPLDKRNDILKYLIHTEMHCRGLQGWCFHAHRFLEAARDCQNKVSGSLVDWYRVNRAKVGTFRNWLQTTVHMNFDQRASRKGMVTGLERMRFHGPQTHIIGNGRRRGSSHQDGTWVMTNQVEVKIRFPFMYSQVLRWTLTWNAFSSYLVTFSRIPT